MTTINQLLFDFPHKSYRVIWCLLRPRSPCCNESIIFLPCPSRLLSHDIDISLASQEYCTDFDEGDNHYHEQIKWLHFGQHWNRDKGAECDRIFESTSIGVARCQTGADA